MARTSDSPRGLSAADTAILAEHGIKLDESLLTGEVDPAFKTVGDEALSGSAVVAGHGLARVCRVGAASFANQLTAEAKLFSLVNSELHNSINRILRVISWALIPLVALAVNGQMQALGGWSVAIETGTWQAAVVRSVASTIGLILLGLVLITSIAFALEAVTLSRQQVLIQKLPAVEGRARVDIVCLDKAETLTEGQSELLPLSSVPFSSALKWSAVSFGPVHARTRHVPGADSPGCPAHARLLPRAGCGPQNSLGGQTAPGRRRGPGGRNDVRRRWL